MAMRLIARIGTVSMRCWMWKMHKWFKTLSPRHPEHVQYGLLHPPLRILLQLWMKANRSPHRLVSHKF
ncbi:hypothetical protein H4S00_000439 [Coemansia sp. D1744]|nr:hypothetical protein H4S00_000439 [Coemansia sp. D1744]